MPYSNQLSKTPTFVECLFPAPILNTPNFSEIFGGFDGATLHEDAKGHIRALEFVALKGFLFEVKEVLPNRMGPIYKVSTSHYGAIPLYLDSRFTSPTPYKTSDRSPIPSKNTMLETLLQLEGSPYVWGGNWSQGIPNMLHFYPPSKMISSKDELKWILKGVDCSGLLFEATLGHTPRNTSQLLSFGQALPIKGKTIDIILSLLKPLDLIIYPGHVIIVLDDTWTIESKETFGVIKTLTASRLERIFETRKPVNQIVDPQNEFEIRRWI